MVHALISRCIQNLSFTTCHIYLNIMLVGIFKKNTDFIRVANLANSLGNTLDNILSFQPKYSYPPKLLLPITLKTAQPAQPFLSLSSTQHIYTSLFFILFSHTLEIYHHNSPLRKLLQTLFHASWSGSLACSLAFNSSVSVS